MTTLTTYLDGRVDERISRTGRHNRAVQTLVVYLVDALLITLALVAVVAARGLLRIEDTPTDRAIQFGIPMIGAAWMTLLYFYGASNPRHLRAGAVEYKRVLMASFTLAAAVGVGAYLLQTEFPRSVFLLIFTFGTGVLLLGRFTRRRAMVALHSRGIGVTPLLVAGESGHVDAIAKVLRRETWLGYRVVGAVTSDHQVTTPAGLPVLGRIDETVNLVDDLGVHGVIFAEGSFQTPADFRRTAWQLEAKDIQMIVVPAVTDISAQRLEIRPVAGLPLLDVDRPQAIAAARWIKRTFDLVGSALLLIAAAPVMALVALAIKLEDGGPVLFRQTRVGLKGETFECLKFRSMVPDAEARLAALAASNEGAGPLFKMTKDPRITRIGRFIRRFSLDELPQFFNAFRGDMSLVGPRPALPAEVAQYDSDARRRLDVRPGLTGLWQVSGRSNLSWDDTVRLDLYYVDNWSLVQDLMILAKTARAVVGSSGAY
jgi:exopolysaccharide biosynthesis polyprenyl glycosylphosphotransferase